MGNLTELTDEELLKKMYGNEPWSAAEQIDCWKRTGYQRPFTGTYTPPDDGTEYWDTSSQINQMVERHYLPEPDYKLESVKAASTILSENLEQFMSRVEFIYKYLTNKKPK